MIALLIDADNFSSPAWIEEAIQVVERSSGPIAIRRAYGSAENMRGLADIFRSRAIRPFVNLSLTKNTTDMSLAVDAMELACLTPRPELFVIASGDMDFLPLVVRLREKGIKVVCVTEPAKMAQDAIPAYDQIIYVGANPSARPRRREAAARPAPAPTSAPAATPKPSRRQTAKAATQEPAKPVKAVAKKSGAKSESKAERKAAGTPNKAAATVEEILAALPKLQGGEWLPLGQIAKTLHDKELLSKSATCAKLFRKFPENFELTPAAKPNRVRLLKA